MPTASPYRGIPPRVSILCLAVILSGGHLGAQQGYRLLPDAVVVDAAEHWHSWSFPHGTLDISETGELSPRRWRRHTEVTANIVAELRLNPPDHLSGTPAEEITLLDAIRAGSNRLDVVDVFDGDMSTFWEPEQPSRATADLAARWWFTVDLGRIVLAERIVLRFVDKELGDPFKLFEVLTSDGQKPFAAPQSQNLEFSRVYRSLHPNHDERLIEIDLSTLPETESRKRVVRYVQVVVHGSSRSRGREITQDEYERLRTQAPADTGLIEYAKTLSTGGELAVSQEDWKQLDASRRGPIRYFRRELPRLAELEVWSKGDDLFSGTLLRGGSVVETQKGATNPQALFDNDVSTYVRLDQRVLGQLVGNRQLHEVFVDLGSTFWIDRQWMTLTFRTGATGTLGAFRLDFADGSPAVDGSPQWITRVARTSPPKKTVPAGLLLLYEFDFQPVRARFFRLQYTVDIEYIPYANAALSELQLLGEGYQPEVTVTSDLIQLGDRRNLVSVSWDADIPAGTRLALQSRTGSTLDTVYHYFKVIGGDTIEVDEQAYNKLRVGKGPIVPQLVASERWEPWSPPYDNPSGSAITSPSPREYALLRATLFSDDPDRRATLRQIELEFDEPVARGLQGEVMPREVEALGVGSQYSLVIELDTLAHGFDELLVRPPAGMQMVFDGLYAGRRTDFGADPDAGLPMVDGVQVLATGDSLHLSFPGIDPADGVDMLHVAFTGTLYSLGGRLQAMLRRADGGRGSWQRVDEKVARLSLTLVADPQRRHMLSDVSVEPSAFTPNGDGVNDEVSVSFTLLLAGGDAVIEAEILDLAGKTVRRLADHRVVAVGAHVVSWDGSSRSGQLVPPGLYVLRLGVAGTGDADLDRRQVLRTIAVCY